MMRNGTSTNWTCMRTRTSVNTPGGGGALPLWESVGMPRGFAPHFRHLDDLFAPQNLTMSTILFRSCWVSFRSPPFSACRRSFCPPNWPNLSFYSDLVGSHFELLAAHPYCFWPRVPPPRGKHSTCAENGPAPVDGPPLHWCRYAFTGFRMNSPMPPYQWENS